MIENIRFRWKTNETGVEVCFIFYNEDGKPWDGAYGHGHATPLLTESERTQFENGIRIGLTRERMTPAPTYIVSSGERIIGDDTKESE